MELMVTNAFRLLVCLGRPRNYEEDCDWALGHKRLSAFGMSWTEVTQVEKAENAGVSQTPFGFWYVLDCEFDWKTIVNYSRRSQTPFGFWYVLDHYCQNTDTGKKVRSQTPFGFWYVLDASQGTEEVARSGQGSQTPFGFWYVLDRPGAACRTSARLVTNAFRLLVCLGRVHGQLSPRMGNRPGGRCVALDRVLLRPGVCLARVRDSVTKEDVMMDEKTAYYEALRRLNEAEDKLRGTAVCMLTTLVDSGLEINEEDKAEFRNVRLAKERAYEEYCEATRKAWK